MNGQSDVERKIDQLLVKVDRIEKKLYMGNGDSIVTAVRVNSEKINAIIKGESDQSGRLHSVAMAFIAFILSLLGGGVVVVANHLIGAR